MEKYSLEHSLLLLCARTTLKAEENKKLQQIISRNPDWGYILQHAKSHRIDVLLYTHLKNLNIPNHIYKSLEEAHTYSGLHNMLYIKELESLSSTKIPFIVLKGPQLAKDIYNNIALRPFTDIDILIAKNNIPAFHTHLTNHGYTCPNKTFYEKYHFHSLYIKSGKMPIYLELHWECIDNFILNRIDTRMLLKETGLAPELNLIYLIMHIEKHAIFNKAFYNTPNLADWIFRFPTENKLIWFTDLYELINKSNIDWSLVVEYSKKWAVSTVVYYTIYIANSLFSHSESQKALSILPPSKISKLKSLFYKSGLHYGHKPSIDPHVQLRAIRGIDLIDYLFPSPLRLKQYYSIKNYFYVILYYPLHFLIGCKEILKEISGIIIYKSRPFLRSIKPRRKDLSDTLSSPAMGHSRKGRDKGKLTWKRFTQKKKISLSKN